MNFDFYIPTRLITGRGCVRKNQEVFRELGERGFIVTSGSAAKKSGALDDVTAALEDIGIRYQVYDGVEPNPSLTGSWEAGRLAREFHADFVIGIGGGSPLDAAKATAVFATNEMEPMEIYKGNWQSPPLPMCLIGTTAGTGSEVGPFAVMTTPEGKKKSFGSDWCFPLYTFGDPGYTDTLPMNFTVSTALDALCHAVEGYFATSANTMSDLFAAEAVRMLYPLLRLLESGEEVAQSTRDGLYYASVLAGMALSRCGTCYCHTLGYFLSEEHGVAHGTACAVFLPDFIRRQTGYLPEKARLLEQKSGCAMEELGALVERMHHCPTVKVDEGKINSIVADGLNSNNFKRTAPSGYSAPEAKELLTRLFG